MSHKNPRSHKDEIKKLVDSIEQEESKESNDIADLEDSIEENTEFSEEIEGTIAPIENAGSEEIKHGKMPHSKEVAIDEDALRKNKRSITTTQGKIDSPSDDSEKAE